MTLQQQKQEELKVNIREQLTSVQNWDGVDGGETIEQKRTAYGARLIQQEREKNAALLTYVMEAHQVADANQAAEGTPQTEMKPAKKSWKQRQEEKNGQKKPRAKRLLEIMFPIVCIGM